MNKIYQRIDWENYPSSATPLNEDNLNKMDYAIDKLDDRIVTHETTKLNTATGNTLVKNVTFNEKTGVFTIEKLSGSKITINTALEKISTNFHFNPTTQKLVLTLIDGTVQEIDLSALITQYDFIESDTITFEIDANGKVKANILNGSITGEKLEPNYLANVTLQAKNAKTSADNAKTSEELAYQYAEEARESASQTAKSDAKNITYDNTESGLSATNVKDALDEVAQGSVSAIATETTITDSTNAPLIYGKFKGYTLQDGTPTPDNPVEINGLAKDGAIEVGTTGILGEETTASIPTDAPLYEGDYIEVHADGSGKLVRKMGVSNSLVFSSDNQNVMTLTKEVRYKKPTDMTDDSTIPFYSNIGRWVRHTYNMDEVGICGYAYEETVSFRVPIDTDASTLAPIIVYPLAKPTETPLTAEQVAEFKKLYTFEPVTNVFCEGETEIQYYKNTPSGVAVGTVHRMANDNKATYDGDGNVITETYAKKSNVLSSVAECEASTNTEDIAGASALSELNEVCLKVKNGANTTVDLSAGVKLKDLLSTFKLGQKGSYLNVLELVVQGTSSETYENAFLHMEDSGLYLNSTPFTTNLSGKAIVSIPIDGYMRMINGTICVDANGSYPKLEVVKARIIYS